MDDITYYLYCVGVPLVPLLLGIVALFITRKDSPRQYAYTLAAINIYAMTIIPLYIIGGPQFHYTVLYATIAALLAALLNIVAERNQPERNKTWQLATPLLCSWLIWSAAVLIINYSVFAGEYVDEWAGLAIIFCPLPFSIISFTSVALLLYSFNPDQRLLPQRPQASKMYDPPRPF